MYERLKYYRVKYKYSQQKVAEILNISQSTYSRYENGYVDNISIKRLVQLAKIYGITVDELIK